MLGGKPNIVCRMGGMKVFETSHSESHYNIDSPNFRVDFWQKPSPSGYNKAWSLDAYMLTGAEDVTEVLQWANDNANGRRFEVFVEIDDTEPVGKFETPRKTSLVRLLGTSPNAGESLKIRMVKI